MKIKGYDIVLYNGEKLHFEVVKEDRCTELKPKELENRILDRLSVELDKSNPPCRCHFIFE